MYHRKLECKSSHNIAICDSIKNYSMHTQYFFPDSESTVCEKKNNSLNNVFVNNYSELFRCLHRIQDDMLLGHKTK